MHNIMKSQNYQLRRDILIILTLSAGLAVAVLSVVFQEDVSLSELTASLYFSMMGQQELYAILFVILCLLLTCRACGWDQNDKTINYEILAGHSRSEIFWGRVAVSAIWSLAACILVSLVPTMVLTAVNGWGVSMNMANTMLRYVLVLFVLVRLVSEFVLLTFLLKNCYAAMIIGWVLYATSVIVDMVLEDADVKVHTLFTYSNISMLLDFSHGKLDYIGGKDVMVYSTAIGASEALGTIGTSVLIAALCLGAGYLHYKKTDQ